MRSGMLVRQSDEDPVWLTADECVDKHGVDPMRVATGKIRNKLILRVGCSLRRVWLEDDLLGLKDGK